MRQNCFPRIATKKLRYALELIADARLAPVRPLVNTLKRAQDTLGKPTTVSSMHVAVRRRLIARDTTRQSDCRSPPTSAGIPRPPYQQVPALIQLLETCTETILPHLARRVRRRPLKITLPEPARAPLAKRA